MKLDKILIFIFIGFSVSSCSSDDFVAPDSVPVENEVNEFVWRAMNRYYFWQSGVPALSDDIGSSESSLNEFINSFNTPESLFKSLLHAKDRFSWIVDDYEVLEANFEGINVSFGYEFRLFNPKGTQQVYGFVKYVVPNSPASKVGIKRGDLFTAINGVELTLDNYRSLMFNQTSYTLTKGEVGAGERVNSTDETFKLSAIRIIENPIHHSSVIDLGSTKVGYLVFNQFVRNNQYHLDLNDVFGKFLSEGVTELVMDLRYNSGGSLLTLELLGSMIYGQGTSESVFISLEFNEKLNEFYAASNVYFDSYFADNLPTGQALNKLELNRLFVLTSGNTASASEMLIVALKSYMDITIIGTTTVGKNEISRTLYDSDNFGKENLNPNHKYALQPIIGRCANADGFADYAEGLDPNIEVDERNFIGQIKQLGDPQEALLAEALTIISGGGTRKSKSSNLTLRTNLIDDSDRLKKHLRTIRLD